MTTRWKRLTALMLVLLTLLNAGSALAAEEFWKWGMSSSSGKHGKDK